jgi:hypothetical protein
VNTIDEIPLIQERTVGYKLEHALLGFWILDLIFLCSWLWSRYWRLNTVKLNTKLLVVYGVTCAQPVIYNQ